MSSKKANQELEPISSTLLTMDLFNAWILLVGLQDIRPVTFPVQQVSKVSRKTGQSNITEKSIILSIDRITAAGSFENTWKRCKLSVVDNFYGKKFRKFETNSPRCAVVNVTLNSKISLYSFGDCTIMDVSTTTRSQLLEYTNKQARQRNLLIYRWAKQTAHLYYRF